MKVSVATITRNRKGNASSSAATVEADVIKIGRGADCKIHLPDPRVALYHAAIRHDDKGALAMAAAVGSISLDGKVEPLIALQVGQRIALGPFEIIVLAEEAGCDLSISIECLQALDVADDSAGVMTSIGLHTTGLTKRRAAWILGLGVLAVFLLWPVLSHVTQQFDPTARFTADRAWDVGTLSSGHHSFGKQCTQCHEQPFVAVRNEACEACHKNVGWHFPLTTPAAQKMHNTVFVEGDRDMGRCASCHRDHKGLTALKRIDSALCTDCHATLKQRVAETALPNVADFSKDHPPFRLSMVNASSKQIVRTAPDAALPITEKSGLKFPHDVHLLQKGVRGPNGKVVMECKNCHVADELGVRFKPITMKQHCADCHSLEFEPSVSNRAVPHGNVNDVITTLNEFYAGSALSNAPIDVVTVDGIQRRPGERGADPERTRASVWAIAKAQKIAKDLFEVRACVLCHEVKSPTTQQTWTIAPVAMTQNWLPHAKFRHDKHSTAKCETCHTVAHSKLSADIAIPEIKVCRDCHGGNTSVIGKAPGTCETCHGFHTGLSTNASMVSAASATALPQVSALPEKVSDQK